MVHELSKFKDMDVLETSYTEAMLIAEQDKVLFTTPDSRHPTPGLWREGQEINEPGRI